MVGERGALEVVAPSPAQVTENLPLSSGSSAVATGNYEQHRAASNPATSADLLTRDTGVSSVELSSVRQINLLTN